MEIANIEDKIKKINGRPWFPIEVLRCNGQVINIAFFKGEYHWHKHPNGDETFYVYKGSVTIQIKEKDNINLDEGEATVVPKGTEHCPESEEGAYVLMIEPLDLDSVRS